MKLLAIVTAALMLSGCLVHVGWLGGLPFGHHHRHHDPLPCQPYPQCHIDDSGMGPKPMID